MTNSKTTENSISSHERVSNSNRATPLINLNIPPYNPHQAKTAFLSDHRIINVSTCIPIPNDIIQIKSLNPATNIFARLDFNRCNWPHLAESLRNLDWAHELCKMSPEMLLPFATGMIADKCMLFVPKKLGKSNY